MKIRLFCWKKKKNFFRFFEKKCRFNIKTQPILRRFTCRSIDARAGNTWCHATLASGTRFARRIGCIGYRAGASSSWQHFCKKETFFFYFVYNCKYEWMLFILFYFNISMCHLWHRWHRTPVHVMVSSKIENAENQTLSCFVSRRWSGRFWRQCEQWDATSTRVGHVRRRRRLSRQHLVAHHRLFGTVPRGIDACLLMLIVFIIVMMMMMMMMLMMMMMCSVPSWTRRCCRSKTLATSFAPCNRFTTLIDKSNCIWVNDWKTGALTAKCVVLCCFSSLILNNNDCYWQ